VWGWGFRLRRFKRSVLLLRSIEARWRGNDYIPERVAAAACSRVPKHVACCCAARGGVEGDGGGEGNACARCDGRRCVVPTWLLRERRVVCIVALLEAMERGEVKKDQRLLRKVGG
jgi:hypothetical protein